MKPQTTSLRPSLKTLKLVALVAASLTACEGWGSGVFERKWTEDVLLPDGKTVLVQRTVKVQETNSLSGDAYNAVELAASIRLAEKLPKAPAWNFPLTAMLLYQDEANGEWAIVASTSSCDVIFERGNPRYLFRADRPPTVYFEFRLRGAKWEEVPLSKESIGRSANLVQSYKAIRQNHVTHEMRASLDGDPLWVEESKKIVEVPKNNCGQTTDTKAIWESEDRALAALERSNASATDRRLVMELLAGTRIVYVHDKVWAKDSDPKTVQYVSRPKPEGGGSGVSEDGQMIYDDYGPYNNDAGLIRDSYTHRLKFAGLGKYAE